MKSFRAIPRPFLVSVFCDTELDSLRAAMEDSARLGAGAMELNLAQWSSEQMAFVAGIAAEAKIPVYTACRRRVFMSTYDYDPAQLPCLSDEERIGRQLRLLGPSVAIDMEFDTFAEPGAPPLPGVPPSGECVSSEASVGRQRDVIDDVHRRGFEVVLSCHTGAALTVSETLLLAEAMELRGADAIKIIHQHNDPAYCLELWTAILRLRRRLSVPFILLSVGPGSGLIRRMACHLGCSYALTRPVRARHFYPGHPRLDEMAKLFACFPPSMALEEFSEPQVERKS